MLRTATGLTRVTTDELKGMLKALHRGQLRFPLRHADLIGGGLPHIAEKSDLFQGLDEAGTRAVLVAVLAERLAHEK